MTQRDCAETGGCRLSFLPNPVPNNYLRDASVTFLDLDAEGNYKTSIAIRGWVISSIGTPVAVTVTCKGMHVGATDFQFERPDVVAALDLSGLSYKPGFHLRIGTLCLPRKLVLEVWADVELDDGSLQTICLGEVQGDRGALFDDIADSRYSPILVPALGRSGTTLLMGLLNAHPEVIAPGGHPYEYRQASYLWHSLRVITSPANFEMSMHPDGFEINHFYRTGSNPFLHRTYHKAYGLNEVSRWQDETFPVAAINFFKGMVDQYLDRAAIDAGKASAKFLAEKVLISPMNDLVMNVYPRARQIFLVRDIRDSFVSAREFNEKRGLKSFGFDGLTDKEVLEDRAQAANLMVQARRFADDRTLFIRYEDLVQDQRNTLTRLVEFIGIDASPARIDAMLASQRENDLQRSAHSTTPDAASSIERWRSELSAEEQDYCSTTYQAFFETFGYPVK